VTDVWASMGQEDEENERKKIFKSLQVNKNVMNVADKNAIFMHCLPAHRGEEVTSEVLDSKSSVVWQEAENRLHAQKALLEYLLVANI
jgi:ornithine carbamoyltransferase